MNGGCARLRGRNLARHTNAGPRRAGASWRLTPQPGCQLTRATPGRWCSVTYLTLHITSFRSRQGYPSAKDVASATFRTNESSDAAEGDDDGVGGGAVAGAGKVADGLAS